jgi:hypothetical protein
MDIGGWPKSGEVKGTKSVPRESLGILAERLAYIATQIATQLGSMS